ncbi:MAG: DUF92 domain-containing protein, partial [Anaerolineae bacterium]
MNIQQFFLGLMLSALMGGLGYWRQALSTSGVIGAILVGTLIFGLGGWVWGLLLIAFFVSSSWLSHYRRADKEAVSVKFAKGSRRDIGQVLANGGLGAILAIVFSRYPEPLLFAAFVGVMATVNADTWATELGVLSRVPPRLITTGDVVVPGTSGGVTRLGIWASVAGSLLIGTIATALAQIVSLVSGSGWSLRAISYTLLAVVGGLAGSLFDSLLGATVQGIYYCEYCGKETESSIHHCGRTARPLRGWGWLNNDLVNL